MVLRIPGPSLGKVSDVAVKIRGKWGGVFILGKNNGENIQGFHTLLCILNVLKH